MYIYIYMYIYILYIRIYIYIYIYNICIEEALQKLCQYNKNLTKHQTKISTAIITN